MKAALCVILCVATLPACDRASRYFRAGEEAASRGDDKAAAVQFLEAARRGHVPAQVRLGALYFRGSGFPMDQAEAARWWRIAAEAGSAAAQHNLAVALCGGHGVPRDCEEGIAWYRRAAERGLAESKCALGALSYRGEEVRRDYAEAARWWQAAADAGDPWAQGALGALFYHGRGVRRDYAEAARCWRAAADAGDPWARGALGTLFHHGRGVRRDYAEAARCWRAAADAGVAEAQYNLGVAHRHGRAVPRDPLSAYVWFDLAVAGSSPDEAALRSMAVRARNAVERRMSREELAAAKGASLERMLAMRRREDARLRRGGLLSRREGYVDMGKGHFRFEGKRHPRLVRTEKAGIEMALIEPGTFMMGSPDTELLRLTHEGPRRRVKLTRPFYLGTYEITVGQFALFAESTGYTTVAEREGHAWVWNGAEWSLREGASWRSPGHAQDLSSPVTCVTWYDAEMFCRWVGGKCRLPTEAEWEYACRAGSGTAYFWGDRMDGDYCWYTGNAGDRPRPVGGRKPNGWGLFDMSGNVLEWCADWYGGDSYRRRPVPDVDPTGPPAGQFKVLRGGSWFHYPRHLRSAYRFRQDLFPTSAQYGFRVACPL
ncbi:MAG: SUMF1/EgtB/PvdO family nonheme iron enzyme [bacterium]|nr:SUMF1/EgtB/PvdO family nonheme iron enzyme [bacterium]